MRKLFWGALPLVVLLVAACGESDTAVTGADSDVRDGPELLATGTPLGDEFVVPEGSVALTQPIVDPALTGPDSWSVELVPADPVVAMNDLVAQADDLGFELGTFTPTPCVFDDQPTGSPVSNQTPWPPPDGQPVPRSVTCNVSGLRVRGDVADRLELQTGRGFTRTFGQPEGTTGSISIEQFPADALDGPSGRHEYDRTPIAPMPASFPAASDLPDAPDLAPGDPLVPIAEPALRDYWAPRLVDGSRLVVPTLSDICQGGFSAVLDVTGDPDAVMAGYVEQLREWSAEFGQPPTTTESTLFGRRIVHAAASIDGTSLTATMVVGQDVEPTRLNYYTCSG